MLKQSIGREINVVDNLSGLTLNVPYIKQEQSQWCWAACMQMGLRFFDPTDPTTQCKLANDAFELTGCCDSPSSSLCNNPLPIFRVASEWLKRRAQALFKNSSVESAGLRFEIDNQRPVEAGLKWNNGGGHAILIVGYGNIGLDDEVIVHDPWRGILSIVFSELKKAYGLGQWTWTWTGIERS